MARASTKLTDKEEAFILEYLSNGFNGVQAALKTYDTDAYATAAAIASENLKKPKIRTRIQKHFDILAMTAEEALARLTSIARGDFGNLIRFQEDDDGHLNAWVSLEQARELGMMHLIKEVKQTSTTKGEDGELLERTVWVKLHDAHSAIVEILKIHGKFKEKIEHSGEINTNAKVTVYIPDNGRGDR